MPVVVLVPNGAGVGRRRERIGRGMVELVDAPQPNDAARLEGSVVRQGDRERALRDGAHRAWRDCVLPDRLVDTGRAGESVLLTAERELERALVGREPREKEIRDRQIPGRRPERADVVELYEANSPLTAEETETRWTRLRGRPSIRPVRQPARGSDLDGIAIRGRVERFETGEPVLPPTAC